MALQEFHIPRDCVQSLARVRSDAYPAALTHCSTAGGSETIFRLEKRTKAQDECCYLVRQCSSPTLELNSRLS